MSAIAVKKHEKLDTTVLKSCPNLLSSFSLSEAFDYYCLRKQIFGRNLAQFGWHLNYPKCSVTSKDFPNHDVNIERVSSSKITKINDFILYNRIGFYTKKVFSEL